MVVEKARPDNTTGKSYAKGGRYEKILVNKANEKLMDKKPKHARREIERGSMAGYSKWANQNKPR